MDWKNNMSRTQAKYFFTGKYVASLSRTVMNIWQLIVIITDR